MPKLEIFHSKCDITSLKSGIKLLLKFQTLKQYFRTCVIDHGQLRQCLSYNALCSFLSDCKCYFHNSEGKFCNKTRTKSIILFLISTNNVSNITTTLVSYPIMMSSKLSLCKKKKKKNEQK